MALGVAVVFLIVGVGALIASSAIFARADTDAKAMTGFFFAVVGLIITTAAAWGFNGQGYGKIGDPDNLESGGIYAVCGQATIQDGSVAVIILVNGSPELYPLQKASKGSLKFVHGVKGERNQVHLEAYEEPTAERPVQTGPKLH